MIAPAIDGLLCVAVVYLSLGLIITSICFSFGTVRVTVNDRELSEREAFVKMVLDWPGILVALWRGRSNGDTE